MINDENENEFFKYLYEYCLSMVNITQRQGDFNE